MHSSGFLALFLQALCLVPVFGAPASHQPPTIPVTHNHGDFVGVRPGAYEKKSPDVNFNKISIHPGVIVGGPNPEDGKYKVAMISKKLPHNPPQAPIEHFHPDSSAYGNIALHPPHDIAIDDMKPWKDERTGVRQTPLSHGNLEKLKGAMEPHVRWKAPTPPPFPEPRPEQPQGSRPGSRPGSRAPARRPGQQVNKAHAGGSKHLAPGPSSHASGSSQHPAASGSGSGSSRPPTARKDNKGKKPAFRSQSGGGHPARKAGEKRSLRSRLINTY